jgi:hypothetical protein
MVVNLNMAECHDTSHRLPRITLSPDFEREGIFLILIPPVTFDENEWYVLIGMIVLLTSFLLLPRHFPPALTLVILLFSSNLGITVDYILATDNAFNFYDALDTDKFDLFDFIMTNINYGLIGYLFIYFYDKWQQKQKNRILFTLVWIILSVLMEFIGTKLHVYKYINWNISLSFVAYIFIFSFYILFLKIGKIAYSQILKND